MPTCQVCGLWIDDEQHPKPGDRLGLSSDHAGGFQVVFADGTVRFVNRSIQQATLNALFTRNGQDKPGDFYRPGD